ncbi:MAG: NYN domain-containing protein, partial [Planctomycetes bacterium]|nr:NYN domain-containing protein [Planctomycetota bacterium]
MPDGERSLAVFIDFENLALGFQGRRDRFEIERVLERLVEKGKIVAKKAYADWSRFANYTAPLHEAAIELVEIPRRAQTGKNSADIRLCVDAMDLAYSKEHIDTFVVVSGDSDFSPLVSKLKENGKHVIGLGMQESTSELLRDNCDEFIYYEDLGKTPTLPPAINPQLPETKRKAFALLLESLLALRRENKEVLWSSMIKDTMKRKKPSFNENYHGYRTFSELLEDAQKEGLLELETDKRSRTYVVTRFGSELTSQAAPPANNHKKKSSRRRRSSGKRRSTAAPSRPVVGEEVSHPSGEPAAKGPPEAPEPDSKVSPDGKASGEDREGDERTSGSRKKKTTPEEEI